MPDTVREEEFVVEGHRLTDAEGTLAASVLSTPALISEMEKVARRLGAEHLAEGQASVGFEVCIKHVAGAPEGARCVARATLLEIVDGRRLRFEVEVREGDRVLGVGRHERRVVPTRR